MRVGLGLAGVEETSIRVAAAALAEQRAAMGLPLDPAGDRLRDTPYFTMVPAPLEDPAVPTPTLAHRFAHGALAPLRARILVTIGNDRELGELGPLPPNVHAERWVPQDAVAPHAAAIVCHGGYGSTLGALRHGVPLVVLPLFSFDQWINGAAVARAGAGVALDAELGTRRVTDLPSAATLDELAPAVERVLTNPSYRREARRMGDATHALAPVDAAVDALVAISAEHAPRRSAPPRRYATYTGVCTGERA